MGAVTVIRLRVSGITKERRMSVAEESRQEEVEERGTRVEN